MAAGHHDWKESDIGKIYKVSGPLVVADEMTGAFMHELVRVGDKSIVGEIIKIEGDTASIQCYEDTSGLRVGDLVHREKQPLSVELGPGIMEQIVDGIQRPLQVIYDDAGEDPYVPLGVSVSRLNRTKRWRYTPTGMRRRDGHVAGSGTQLRPGDLVEAGTVLGEVFENELLSRHKIMMPPEMYGEVVAVHGADGDGNEEMTIDDPILTIRRGDTNEQVDITMSHFWPVRKPRPVARKLPGEQALITGQRVIDVLFPSVLGGTCAIPGAFGCGKTCISQALSKYSNTDAIVYVGCGERGNEMAEVLADFPELTTTVAGEEIGIMKRTCLVANTSNMPVAAREASIYTGITIAEYFRDQGMHVAMMADSTSRWAEALREISGRLGEMPADGGYPAYLSARLARFYERAGLAQCIGSPSRKGSVTVVGAVSPPGGDFSDPVTSATLGIVQVFWGLDKKLAQRKHFPSLNWSISYTKYKRVLDPFFDSLSSQRDYSRLRDVASAILQMEGELNEIVQLVGEDSLSPEQKLTMEVARIIREDFLQQDAFSAHDFNCPLSKSLGMLRCIVRLYDRCRRAIAETEGEGAEGAGFTWATLKRDHEDLLERVTAMKFEDPRQDEEALASFYDALASDIDATFDQIAERMAGSA